MNCNNNNILIKIILTELKKSLNAIKNNNLLTRIHSEQLVNIDNNTTFPLINLNDVLNGTLNILTLLNNRGFIDVKKIFENNYEQTELITINPTLHNKLKIPLSNVTTLYNKGDVVFIYPQNNRKNKYLRGIVDKYKYNNLFIKVFDINGTAWKVKNVYNIHKDYSYQYIIKLPFLLNNKTINNLNILKINLSYFFKTNYTFMIDNGRGCTNYIIDLNKLIYDNNVWTNDNVTINNYENILEQIITFKDDIDNIYSTISQYNP
jgi:hypothetical protein